MTYRSFIHCTGLFLIAIQISAYGNSSGAYAPWVGDSFDGGPCRGGGQGYGPYDYRKRHSLKANLNIVESVHFTSNVESLIRGESGDLASDLDYTLRAWPNHHRALYTAIRYQFLKEGNYPPSFALAECYLQRAIHFSPKDDVPYMLFGILLQRKGKLQEASEKYTKALDINPQNPQTMYNFALLLVDMKKYEEAKGYATQLYSRNFPLQGLKNKLIKAGHWGASSTANN